MPQSLFKVYAQFVFSTKHRECILDEEIQSQLYSFMAAYSHQIGVEPIQIGGVEDHVHILCLLSRKTPTMNFVRDIKSHSSQWLKKQHPRFQNFHWQDGYGAFSVSAREVPQVQQYIIHQKEHHKHQTSKDEYRSLLREAGIEWDERYVWD